MTRKKRLLIIEQDMEKQEMYVGILSTISECIVDVTKSRKKALNMLKGKCHNSRECYDLVLMNAYPARSVLSHSDPDLGGLDFLEESGIFDVTVIMIALDSIEILSRLNEDLIDLNIIKYKED